MKANVVNQPLNGLTSDSLVFFQNQNVVVMNNTFYQSSAINTLSTTTSTAISSSLQTSVPASIHADSNGSTSSIFNPTIVGGFTALGIVVGSLLTAFIFFICTRHRRRQNVLPSQSEFHSPHHDCKYT
jgi:hypothetical protein